VLFYLVRLKANSPIEKNAILPEIGQAQSQHMAVECVHDIGKRLLPTRGIKRAVVYRSNQFRKGLTRNCIGHDHPLSFCGGDTGHCRDDEADERLDERHQ
jgi:hypothetical protein